jgi:TolB-like protein
LDRRQTTILAADMVGYSRLMAADEEGVITRLRKLRAELIDPAIAANEGRIVKTMGDGLLVEFPVPAGAVRTAITVQQAMNAADAGLPETERFRFRIGVNAGEVIVDGDDVLGDAVNIAARLETLAPPGGACVSRAVHAAIGDEIPSTALGPQYVKNIPEPVEVWRLDIPGAATSAMAQDGDRPSIAILPFDNMSADPDQEFLADGIVEDVTTELSRFRSLLVIARNSTFAYKGARKDIREIAKELDVRYVVEGSVRRAGNRLRVTAQLIEAATGAHLWAERWDRTMEDVFDLQDELTAAVVKGVAPEIGAHEREQAMRKPTESLSAWELLHRGIAEHLKFTPEGFAKAGPFYEASAAIDPRNPLPHAWMARLKTYAYIFDSGLNIRECARAGLAFAEAAVALDDRSDDAYAALGYCLAFLGRKREAVDAIETGLALNHNNANLHHFRSIAEFFSPDPDANAMILGETTALRLSPKDPIAVFFHHLRASARLFLDPDDSESLAQADYLAACAQPNPPSYVFAITACLLARSGKPEDAVRYLDKAIARQPDISVAFIRRLSSDSEIWTRLWPTLEPGYRALIPLGLPGG